MLISGKDSGDFPLAPHLLEMFRSAPVGIAVYEPLPDESDYRILAINECGCALSEVDADRVVGRNLKQVFPGADDMGFTDTLARVWQTGNPSRLSARLYQDNERFPNFYSNFVFKAGDQYLVAAYVKHGDDEEIAASLHTDSHLHGSGPVVNFLMRMIDGRPYVDYVSPNITRLLGVSAFSVIQGEVLIEDLMHPADFNEFRERVRSLLDGDSGCKTFTGGPILLNYKQQEAWVFLHAGRLSDSSNVIAGYVVDVSQLVTEHKQRLAADTRYRLLAESALVGVWDWDIDGRSLAVSDRLKHQLGYRPHELDISENSIFDRVHPDEREALS